MLESQCSTFERWRGGPRRTVKEKSWTLAERCVKRFWMAATQLRALQGGGRSQRACSTTRSLYLAQHPDSLRSQAEKRGGEGRRRCTHPVSPSSLTLSHTLRATSQLISVCFSSVALAVWGRGAGGRVATRSAEARRRWPREGGRGSGLTDDLVVRVGWPAEHGAGVLVPGVAVGGGARRGLEEVGEDGDESAGGMSTGRGVGGLEVHWRVV